MNKKGPVFLDPALQKSFDENGFVKIKLLNPEQADLLCKGYLDYKDAHEKIDRSFITTSHSSNAELITEVDKLILSVVEPEIPKHISGSKTLFSNFLVKRNGPDSASSPHQDATLVDENNFISFSIWVALEDIDESNGGMRMLPGSHKFDFYLRPNPEFPWKYKDIVDSIQRDMVDCPTKKGEALVFSHSLIHGSSVNSSDKIRLAAVIAMYPEDTELFHFHLDKFDAPTVKQYKMEKEAFLKYVKGAPPHFGELINELPFENKIVTERAYQRLKQGKKLTFLDQIKEKIFS